MGSPAYFAKLAALEAMIRKPGLVSVGLFNATDNLNFIPDMPSSANQLTTATVPFSSTPAFDTSVAKVLTITLTGNVTSSTLNFGGSGTIPTGTWVYLRIVEDGAGGHTFALPANLHTDVGFAIDTGASRINILPIRWNGVNWEFVGTPFSVAP